MSGIEVPTPFIDFISPIEIDEPTVSGPVLGLILRHALQSLYQSDDIVNWVFRGRTIQAQIDNNDHIIAGFKSMTAWADKTRPGGMARTQVTNLLTYWNVVHDRIEAAGAASDDPYTALDVLRMLERSAIEEMVGLLAGKGVDVRATQVICSWILSQDLTTVRDFRALKESAAFQQAGPFMDMLESAGLDPREVYISLVGEENPADKLGPIVDFVNSGRLGIEHLAGFVSQMAEMPTAEVSDMCATPHGRTEGFDDADAAAFSKEIEDRIETIQPGQTDTHTGCTLQVEDLGGGYIKLEGIVSVSELYKLFRANDLRLMRGSLPLDFDKGRLVYALSRKSATGNLKGGL